MTRRSSMCKECPFRDDVSEWDMGQLAKVEFTCHEEDGPIGFGTSGIQCRGHWEAVRKFNRTQREAK